MTSTADKIQSIYKCEKCGIIRVFPIPEDGKERDVVLARCVRCEEFKSFHIEKENPSEEEISDYFESILEQLKL